MHVTEIQYTYIWTIFLFNLFTSHKVYHVELLFSLNSFQNDLSSAIIR